MDRQGLTSKTVVLLMVYQTVTAALNTTVTKTSTEGELVSAATTSDYVTHTGPWQPDTAAQNVQIPTLDPNPLSLVDDVESTAFSLSTDPDKGCQSYNQTLTERTGIIAMSVISCHCFATQVWTIHLPSPEDGTVLVFNYIIITDRSILKIFTFMDNNRRLLEREFKHGSPLETYPLLLQKHRVQIVFKPIKTICVKLFSQFNITYFDIPLRKMPRKIPDRDPIVEFYNCSGDVIIPPVLRCNTVKECVHNEDENECDYTYQACGAMVRFRDLCFKIHFNRPDIRYRVTVVLAQKTCSTLYGAELAVLKNADDRNFVLGIMRQVGVNRAIVGLNKVRPKTKSRRHFYRYLWQWGGKGGSIVYDGDMILYKESDTKSCAMIVVTHAGNYTTTVKCSRPIEYLSGYVCTKPLPSNKDVQVDAPLSVHLSRPSQQITQFPTKKCADSSLVQTFHPCYQESEQNALARSSYNFPLYPCRYGLPVHYTLVCDGHADCKDGSDETDCGGVSFPPLSDSMFKCQNFQLIPHLKRCDGHHDCFDETDEEDCTSCNQNVNCAKEGCLPPYYNYVTTKCPGLAFFSFNNPLFEECTNPCLVTMDGFGMAFWRTVNHNTAEEAFRCKNEDYYIPSFLLNNGEQDCPSGEDENIPLENLTCPGFYRCQYSENCIHPVHVCDGIIHCPFKDDERYCGIVCPRECLCEGYAFTCTHSSNISALALARFLDLSGSRNISLKDIHFLELLRFLNLTNCGLNFVSLKAIPKLEILDVSFNELKGLSSFRFEGLAGLKYLYLSGNPFETILHSSFVDFIKLSDMQNLKTLVIRHTELQSIKNRAFSSFTQLETLDIRDNFLHSYDSEMFWGLNTLQKLYTDEYKLCCPYFHNSRKLDCVAPQNELSSCSDLLRLNVYRVFLWLTALLATFGNICVMLYRVYAIRKHSFSTFGVLVMNLCAADLCMGIYIMMIGIADARFLNVYVAKEDAWKRSVVCKVAGFLGFVSSEASALTICLITLDRVLALCFPLKSHLHMTARSSVAACGMVWFVAVTLAAVPLLADLEYYGVSSICLPLPITMRKFSGQFYAFGVFIVFNFVIFILIGLGQILIHHAIRSASKAAGTNRRPQEMAIARRLFLVVLSDFCCWFPVGLMGLLVSCGIPISDEVNVWTAIFVLPLNSALNPFLYTLNTFLEKWREQKLNRETNKILRNVQRLLPRMLPSTAEELVKICIRSHLVKTENILLMLETLQDNTLS